MVLCSQEELSEEPTASILRAKYNAVHIERRENIGIVSELLENSMGKFKYYHFAT
jgi:hypothetical protein